MNYNNIKIFHSIENDCWIAHLIDDPSISACGGTVLEADEELLKLVEDHENKNRKT